jgi:hypothetical protein
VIDDPSFGLTSGDLRALRALRTPRGIERALDAMPYHLASTAWSPRRVLQAGTAHCLEGAVFAAAALRAHSRPVNLARFDASHPGWMTAEGDLWWIAEHLAGVQHTPLLPPAIVSSLRRVDRRSLRAAMVGYRASTR